MERVVVDTDVVSFYLKGDSRFDSYSSQLDGKQLVMSFQTLGELLYWQELHQWGERRRELFSIEIREHYIVFPVDQDLCRTWARLRAEVTRMGRVIQMADAWIAATALALDVPLVTHNARDFDYLPNLKLITFPTQ